MVVLSKCITTFVSNRAQAVRKIFSGSKKSAEQNRFQCELKLIKEKFKETVKLEDHWRQSRMTNGLKLLEMKHLQNEYSNINGRCIDMFASLDNLITSDSNETEADDEDNDIVENGIDVEVAPVLSSEKTFNNAYLKWVSNLKIQISDLSDHIVAQMEPIVYGLNPPRNYVKPKNTPQGTFVGKRKNRNDTFKPAEKHLALGGAVDAEVPGCSKWTSSSCRTFSGSSYRSSSRSSSRSSFRLSPTSSRSSVFSTSSQ